MSHSRQGLEQTFEKQVQTLSLTLQHATVRNYRSVFHRFLAYLHASYPQVRQLSQLRRDPHMLSWFRRLCEQDPPLGNSTRTDYLVCLRRLLDDLAIQGYRLQPGLILREDFSPRREYLPRPGQLYVSHRPIH